MGKKETCTSLALFSVDLQGGFEVPGGVRLEVIMGVSFLGVLWDDSLQDL